MWDIIIVGGGTAGLTAAVYGSRAGRKVLLLESSLYGGQIVTAHEIENYPAIPHISGADFATALYEQAKAMGTTFAMEPVTAVSTEGEQRVVTTPGNRYTAHAVILATGAKNRPLGLEREAELVGRGVSYCATCDGAFFKGKDVAVVGGGNTALDDALFLSRRSRVTLIHRRDTFRGEPQKAQQVRKAENITILYDSAVSALHGEDSLSSITVQSLKDGSSRELAVSGLFVAIGQMPDNEAFRGVVDLDEKGYILADETCHTRTPGIFAAGDCRQKRVRQLSTAAGDGTVAALEACEFIDALS